MAKADLYDSLSELEARLSDLEPHLRYLVARVIDAALAVDDTGPDTDRRLQALPELVALTETVDWCVRMEIHGLRTFTWFDVSWTDIGEALGVSRQAARQRFRMDGDVGKADAEAERMARAAEAKRKAVLAQLAADQAHLEAQRAAGELDAADYESALAELIQAGFERLMSATEHGSKREHRIAAEQAWYRAASERLGEDEL